MTTNKGLDVERPTLDVDALSGWLGDRLGDPAQELTAEPLGTDFGMGNALFELRRGDRVWVLARPPAILHGDYSPFNVMVAPNLPPRLAAVIDWDTGTIGDPLLDLGHLLARWTEPGEASVLQEQAGGTKGYPTRAEMAKRYAERSGR